MRLRNRYRMPLTAIAMGILVMLMLYPLNMMFANAQPMRPAEKYDNYQGKMTYCSTFNHYVEKDQHSTTVKLMEYANDNAMSYLIWRFGKDQGKRMVDVCEHAQQRYIVEQCQQQPDENLEQLILNYNRQAVKQSGAI
ncbi:hypothetical protein [Ferrimonas lipolytica]|uniref:Uncharacterized protein n=1 Tax=Ferrimonas lipolytica TaxID=2724191 RepID=A0A6H1UD85_9GAMM|nr:hypothetical protein [Ferrimonas lipolytica]QIZ77045.1 hypothetical protein HER31_09210 [Ferrimonas lipolytica]